MKTAPIQPARIEFDARGLPFSPDFGDIYHPQSGALAQARHVFLGGNALPARWQGRPGFTILETGFGLGNNFLATWDAWRHDPRRPDRLVFVSIELQPPSAADLARIHHASPLADLAAPLLAAWPPLTPNLHSLSFDDGRVRLLLALGDVQSWLPALEIEADAFYLDGFAPARNPRMWDARVCKALGRRAAMGATLATWTAARGLREGLTSAGFEVRLGQGAGGKRDITLATYAPAFAPRRAPGRARARPADEPARDAAGYRPATDEVPAGVLAGTSSGERALIIGGGLAGTAAAWALAEQGWHCTLLERGSSLAGAASGNPAGLFHGVVHPQDGPHARFNRAAALAIGREVRTAIDAHDVPGSVAGLLRLESSLPVDAMRALIASLGLPAGYVEALDAGAASALAGLALPGPAWHYPGGGWVQPAGLARAFVERGAARVRVRVGVPVAAIRRAGLVWQAIGAAGTVIDEAPALVLANAGDALRLIDATAWPMSAVRGQISLLPTELAPAALGACRRPIAGAGYLLPPTAGVSMFGATSQPGDFDPGVRLEDHATNLRQLRRLTGLPLDIDPGILRGRTAWRWTAPDRLPIVGEVPALSILCGASASAPTTTPNGGRWDQPRFVPRETGLFVFTALGSRGIAWSALGAQVLAALVSGGAVPLEADLLDAIDPARFISRGVRRSGIST